MSLPDDVAEYLDKHPNSSAIVTAAVRARMERGASTRAMLEAAGFLITDEGIAQWHDKLKPFTPEQRAEAQSFQAALESGRLPEPR